MFADANFVLLLPRSSIELSLHFVVKPPRDDKREVRPPTRCFVYEARHHAFSQALLAPMFVDLNIFDNKQRAPFELLSLAGSSFMGREEYELVFQLA